MTLGFYYHITLHAQNKQLYLPGYVAVFINALAQEVDKLVLFLHEAEGIDIEEADSALIEGNIEWINLGIKSPAWYRSIFHKKTLKTYLDSTNHLDAILVRSPTPLAPYFYKYIERSKIIFMIVGNYADGAKHYKFSSLRDIGIKTYIMHNHWLFEKQISKAKVLVNSPKLYEKYKSNSVGIQQIITTTIMESDFYEREDTCKKKPINLLYTGRIDPAKGLFELVEATALLKNLGYDVILHLVGWEHGGGKKVESKLKIKGKKLNITSSIIFHGRKTVGEGLNKMYKMADIYIIPSYHEGFPKTIWEAMANGLPVIATEVGGIPYYLSDKENVFLIKPRSSDQIVSAVKAIIEDEKLRQKLIKNGLKKAQEVTVSSQTKKMVNSIKEFVKESI
jgi:glycosyltransferase involved in cell wall biosynthesis